jgi:hypothetical protein
VPHNHHDTACIQKPNKKLFGVHIICTWTNKILKNWKNLHKYSFSPTLPLYKISSLNLSVNFFYFLLLILLEIWTWNFILNRWLPYPQTHMVVSITPPTENSIHLRSHLTCSTKPSDYPWSVAVAPRSFQVLHTSFQKEEGRSVISRTTFIWTKTFVLAHLVMQPRQLRLSREPVT